MRESPQLSGPAAVSQWQLSHGFSNVQYLTPSGGPWLTGPWTSLSQRTTADEIGDALEDRAVGNITT